MKTVPFYFCFILLFPSCLPEPGTSKEQQRNRPLEESYIFIGRPNIGKSTLINSIIGKQVVPYGPTTSIAIYEHNGKKYIDTPAIDPDNLVKSGQEIKNILRKNVFCKIVFVVNLKNEDVDPIDVQMVKDFFDHIYSDIKIFKIIVNKFYYYPSSSELALAFRKTIIANNFRFPDIFFSHFAFVNLDPSTPALLTLNDSLTPLLTEK